MDTRKVRKLKPEFILSNHGKVCAAMYAAQRLNDMLSQLGLNTASVTMAPTTVADSTIYTVRIDMADVDLSALDTYVPDGFHIGGLPGGEDDGMTLQVVCRSLQDHIEEKERRRKIEDGVLNRVRSDLSPEDLEILRRVKHRI